jgi:hypothetical protein
LSTLSPPADSKSGVLDNGNPSFTIRSIAGSDATSALDVDSRQASLRKPDQSRAGVFSSISILGNSDPLSRIASKESATFSADSDSPAAEGYDPALIDSLTDLSALSDYRKNLDPDRSWQINNDTVKRLRELSKDQEAATSGRMDQVIANWFGGPGGLIEVTAGGEYRLPPQPDLVDQVVEVNLDSTWAIHRTIELIGDAGSDLMTDDVRLSVLAEWVRAESENGPPITIAAEVRLSTISYLGVALIAGGAVWAATRKPSMASNRSMKCDSSRERSGLAKPSRDDGR